MSKEPKTPMTEMHNFIIETQYELFNEKKSPEVLKLVLMLNELSKITQKLLEYEKTYIDLVRAEGMQEGIDVSRKIIDNKLNNLDNGNFFTACIN